jgi:hypothetical protein
MFRKIFILTIISVHFLFSTAFAVEVAPRITDREIVEALTELKAGQKHLNQRIDDTNQRISDLYDINLTMFATLAALITGLFGYIIWDRRTMMKPVQERLERLEKDIERDLDPRNEHGSLPTRLLKVLREMAKTDEKLAAVLRSFSLL